VGKRRTFHIHETVETFTTRPPCIDVLKIEFVSRLGADGTFSWGCGTSEEASEDRDRLITLANIGKEKIARVKLRETAILVWNSVLETRIKERVHSILRYQLCV
jgi:hypothetical protein